jgi:hypothetical protein
MRKMIMRITALNYPLAHVPAQLSQVVAVLSDGVKLGDSLFGIEAEVLQMAEEMLQAAFAKGLFAPGEALLADPETLPCGRTLFVYDSQACPIPMGIIIDAIVDTAIESGLTRIAILANRQGCPLSKGEIILLADACQQYPEMDEITLIFQTYEEVMTLGYYLLCD